ncbi:MAG: hypothetical protein Q8N23_28280 [Archangium sp.]|nr:hypothetical protein [Archangium sp.]MDP3576297.1 hypothetical protein [Archangium sp.]
MLKVLWGASKGMLLKIWIVLKKLTAQWRELIRLVIVDRFLTPYTFAGTLPYLVGVIAALGGAGVWLSQVMAAVGQAQPKDVALNIATYAFAIVFSAIGDLFINKDETNRVVRFNLFLISLVALAGCGWLTYSLVYKASPDSQVPWLTLFGVVAPVWLTWWLVNGIDPRFSMEAAPSAAMGGDPEQDLGK